MPSQFITDLLAAAQPAVELIQKDFWMTTASDSEDKRDFQDIVTATDKQSQALLVAELTQLARNHGLPDVSFIAEESGLATTLAEHTFIIDPIDGTTNFAHRLPHCVISIAYAHNQEVVAGLILQPLTGEYWWAEQGQGAWYVYPDKNLSRSLQIVPRPLKAAIIATHFNSRAIANQQFAWYQALYNQVRAERNLGSLILDLAYCAQDILQGVTNGGCFIWDIAAAKLLVEEAGGVMLTSQGEPVTYNWQNAQQTYDVVAGHAETVAEMLKYKP